MYKFFISKNMIQNDKAILTGENFNHIRNVIRHKKWDKISLFCEEQQEKN